MFYRVNFSWWSDSRAALKDSGETEQNQGALQWCQLPKASSGVGGGVQSLQL